MTAAITTELGTGRNYNKQIEIKSISGHAVLLYVKMITFCLQKKKKKKSPDEHSSFHLC